MGLLEQSVAQLEEIVRDTGCDDGAVTLRRNPDATNCQYERGVCILACYGGRTGEFVTQDPVEATTKIAFMFGTALKSPQAKGAACAILNVLASFLCLARGVRACQERSHPACLAGLRQLLAGKRVFLMGGSPLLEGELDSLMTGDPDHADVILINNEGLVADGASEIVSRCRDRKEIICIGPSTAGVAGLQRFSRFCPYGA